MSSYVANVYVALAIFPVLAALLSLPYAIYQYRRYGSIPWWKTFLVAALIFYLLCAYFMVILPLPANREVYVAAAQTPQLVPFRFIQDIRATVSVDVHSARSWLAALRRPTVYVVLFNLALTMPFGAFMRYLFHRRWWQVLAGGLLLFLFFEVSQLTGLFGIYAHPYRLFDVDDLIVNTTGAMVGFWLSIPACRLMPDLDDVNARARERGASYTTFTRRALAFAIDAVATALVEAGLRAFGGDAFSGDVGALLARTLACGVTFMLIPFITRGQTIGHAVLRLRVVRPDGEPASRMACVARYALLFWGFLLFPRWLVALLPATAPAELAHAQAYATLVRAIRASTLLVQGAWVVSIAVRALLSAFRHPFVMLNGFMTGTRVMSAEQAARLRGEGRL